MEPPGGRDSRFNLGYSMNLLSGDAAPEIYGNPSLGRPSTSLQQLSPRHTMVSSACGGRGLKGDIYDERGMSSQNMGLESCVNDISEDTYSSIQSKKSPPSNGKKTKGRVKIKMEYIENKLRRYTTFSKRKTGIMKKAYELSTLTGTQVMLLVASETGHVYTFATRKLQPMITSEAGKALIQTCLNSPDPPAGSAGGDQRMSATGFEETELTYNISDDDSKEGETGSEESSDEMEQNEDNSNSPEEINPPPESVHSDIMTKVIQTEKQTVSPQSVSTLNATAIVTNKSNTTKDDTEESKIQKSTLLPELQKHLNTTLPLLIPSTANSTNLTCSMPSIPLTNATPNQIQAVPLLLQTPNGMGYASTPDGMILGLLQGPNMVQPQLVALPFAPSMTQNTVKTDSNEKKS